MPGIGLQRQRAVLPGGTKHPPGQHTIERRTAQRQGQTPTDLLDRLGVKQAMHRHPNDAQGGHQDQDAFKTGRKILGLVVAIGVIVVCRARRNRHHHQAKHRTGQIDQRLHRVRQQANRIGHPPGQGFERDGDARHHHRCPQHALGRHPEVNRFHALRISLAKRSVCAPAPLKPASLWRTCVCPLAPHGCLLRP